MIHLNLSSTPITIKSGEFVEIFYNEQACLTRQEEFFSGAAQAGHSIPPFFNLGCVPLERAIM